MRHSVLMFSLLSLSALSSLATAAKPLTGSEREEFKARVYKLWTRWDALDPSKVAEFYSKDPNNVYFDISPLKFQGWAQYAEVAGKSLVEMSAAKWSPNGDDFQVIREGHLAVTTLTFNVVFTNKSGAASRAQVRDTDVWEKQGEKWLIIHEHVSVPQNGFPAPATRKSCQ
jgi:ketosteroid isomerase-like protein